ATAAATANWAQGSSQQTFDVGQGPAQTVTFTNAPLSVVVGGTVDGVATSNGDGVVSYGSADDAACTVTSSGLVTGVATGTDTCVITATAAATANWAQGSSQQTFDVGQGPAQTVTFTNAPLSVVVGGTVDGVATSNGDGTVSYGSADDGACTVTSSGLVTGVAAGTNTCVITATAAATANWAQGSGQQTFSVGQGSVQTVTFGSAPTVAVAGTGATSATTNGDGSISFASSDTAACTVGISTGVVTGVAAGTNNCVITATAASTVNWAQGSAQQTFSIGKGSQTIDFPQPADVTFGVPSVALAATSSSNLTVAFASTTPTICAVSGTTATIVGAGSCSVVASQGGDADYDPAADVTRTFAAGQASQTITFELPSRYSAEVATLPLQATATSGLAVTFTTQTPETCTVSGATANLVAAGTCTITASQAGNTNFVAAPDVTASTLLEQLPPQLVEVCSADGSCVRADLAGLDLSGVNMAGINFAGANFTGANITGSTLQGSNLAGANMTGVIAGPVDLRDTNLTGANFTGADLHGARMQNALLAGTNFAGANLDDVDFTKVRNAKAGRGDQNRVTIRRVNFTEASLRRTKFSWLRLVNVTFTDSNLRKSNMKGVLIDRGAGVRANFGSANLSSATLRNANYKQANFTRANLRNARFINVKLAGANLTKAKLNGTKFIKTSLKHTVRGKQTVRGPSGRIGLDALAMSKSPLVPPATAAPGPTGSAAASGAPRATGQPLPVVEASPGPTSDNAPEPSADVQ
ncbi:MAG: pentapeptide repeat-containing protein, partial [Candidatus Nanopelagicales bacterium]